MPKTTEQVDHLEEARTQLRRAKMDPIAVQKEVHRQYAQAHAAIASAEELRAIRLELEAMNKGAFDAH